MPRELKPHGTDAAYRRHRRAGEVPCDDCKAAHAAARRDRDQAAREARRGEYAAALASTPLPAEPLDVLTELHKNYRFVFAALKIAKPNEVAPLSKRHQELVTEIAKRQQQRPNELADQLAAIRRRRDARREQQGTSQSSES